MLTQRQINILTYLENKKDWVSGEQLTDHFHLDRKTVQSELKQIKDYLGDGCSIETGRKGYQLASFTPAVRKDIYEQISYYGGRNCLGIRPSALVIYLCLLKDYISMQQLADLFYLSKTAISIELDTVKRWIARFDGLDLEISGKRGIKVIGSEHRKRFYLATFGSRHAFRSMPIDEEITHLYEETLLTVRNTLRHEFTAAGLLLTGEEYIRSCRYIAFTVLRCRMGFSMTDDGSKHDCRYLPFARHIIESLAPDLSCCFGTAELHDFAALLAEASYVRQNDAYVSSYQKRVTRGIAHLEDRLHEIIGFPQDILFPDKNSLSENISRLILCSENQIAAINHYNEEIICRYPLETHLMRTLLPTCFDLAPNKETSFLALDLANTLNQKRDRLSVLLVCNQNRSIATHIEHALYGAGIPKINKMSVLPVYAFEQDPSVAQQYDVLLTTSQEILMSHPGFYLIPCILSYDDLHQINAHLKQKAFDHRVRLREKVLGTCFQKIKHPGGKMSLADVIGEHPSCMQSHQTIGSKRLFVCRTGSHLPRQIRVYEMETPILFHYKKIKKIIFASCPKGSADILDFFSVISDLLTEELTAIQ
jgi:lichenan operon transcriptional antiterminator